MKSLRIMKLAAVTMTIAMVASCGSTRKVVNETPNAQAVVQKQEFLQNANAALALGSGNRTNRISLHFLTYYNTPKRYTKGQPQNETALSQLS